MSRLPHHPPAELPEKQAEFYEMVANDRPPATEGVLGGPFDGWMQNPSTTLHRDKRVDDETYAAAVAVHGHAAVPGLVPI